MPDPNQQDLITSRVKFLAIIALVVVPMVLAWVLYFFGSNMITPSQTNSGKLIVPPLEFALLGANSEKVLDGKWALLVMGGNQCAESCNQQLYYIRQVHIALGKYAERLQRIYISTQGELAPDFKLLKTERFPHLQVLLLEEKNVVAVFGKDWRLEQRVYLVDPLGNIMMVYTEEMLGKPMLKDVKHLLKLSNIG